MKLTYIANIRLPTEKAHGIQIMSTVEAFAQVGVDVTLVVSNRKTPISEDSFSFYGIKRIFSIERLATLDFTRHEKILGALAFHIQRLSFARQALKYILRNPADIFYTRDEFTFLYFARKNISIIFEMHTMPKRLYLYYSALRKARKIVVISDHLKEALIQAGIPQEKILVAHDGVDISKFKIETPKNSARAHFDLPQHNFLVLYAGLLDTWKGYETLLKSSPTLNQNGIMVVIAGGTKEQIIKLSNEYPQVIFLGFRKYEDIPELQRAADILCVPNSAKFDIGRLYTSPLKVFTAMASGVPIVASDLPSLREVLSEKTALFFRPDDEHSFADTIISLKENPSLGETLAENARSEVEKYSWVARARNILNAVI